MSLLFMGCNYGIRKLMLFLSATKGEHLTTGMKHVYNKYLQFQVPYKIICVCNYKYYVQPHYGPDGASASNRNEYQKSSWA
jgi:hypothetical protein